MNYFTKSLCNKAAKLHFINLDYIDKYLAILREVKHYKEESTLNKVIYLKLKDNYNIEKRSSDLQNKKNYIIYTRYKF